MFRENRKLFWTQLKWQVLWQERASRESPSASPDRRSPHWISDASNGDASCEMPRRLLVQHPFVRLLICISNFHNLASGSGSGSNITGNIRHATSRLPLTACHLPQVAVAQEIKSRSRTHLNACCKEGAATTGGTFSNACQRNNNNNNIIIIERSQDSKDSGEGKGGSLEELHCN